MVFKLELEQQMTKPAVKYPPQAFVHPLDSKPTSSASRRCDRRHHRDLREVWLR